MMKEVSNFNLHFKIKSTLGQGAQAIVYECEALQSMGGINQGKDYAVKTYIRTQYNYERVVKREFKTVRLLNDCQNINYLHAVIIDPIAMYLIFDLALEGTLEDHISQSPFSEKQMLIIIEQLLLTTHLLNEIGIIHRDLKPDNILITDLQTLKI